MGVGDPLKPMLKARGRSGGKVEQQQSPFLLLTKEDDPNDKGLGGTMALTAPLDAGVERVPRPSKHPPRQRSRTRGHSPNARRRRSSTERLKQNPGIVRRLANHALQEIHEGLDGERWRVSDGWMVPGSSVGSWHGVHIDGGRLTGLNLLCNGLAGELPASLGDLVTLRELNLSYNHDIVGRIPPSISKLEDLRVLHLYSCSLEGPIPDAVCKLIHLEELWLNGNRLTGPLPTALGKLTSLRELYLNSNDLSGQLPLSFSQLVNLEGLNLGYNRLSGGFPNALGNMVSLRLLVLEGNQMEEQPPADHGRGLARFLAAKRAENVQAMQKELSTRRRESRDRDAAYLALQEELRETRERMLQLEEARSLVSSSSEAGALSGRSAGRSRGSSMRLGTPDHSRGASASGAAAAGAAAAAAVGAAAAAASAATGGSSDGGFGMGGGGNESGPPSSKSRPLGWFGSKLFVSPRRTQSVGELIIPGGTTAGFSTSGTPYETGPEEGFSPGKRVRRRSEGGQLQGSGGRFFPLSRLPSLSSLPLEQQREAVADFLAADELQCGGFGGGGSGSNPGTDRSSANTPTTTTAAGTPQGRRPSLLDVLQGEGGPLYTLERLHSFARSMLLEENIDFWLAIQALRQGDDARLAEEAERLCATFVAATAPHQVNLSSTVREETEETVRGLLAVVRRVGVRSDVEARAAKSELREAFNKAQRQIFDLLRSDAYPRFISALHKELRRFANGTSLSEDDPRLITSCLAARQQLYATAATTPSAAGAASAAAAAAAAPPRPPQAASGLLSRAPRAGRQASFLPSEVVEATAAKQAAAGIGQATAPAADAPPERKSVAA